MAQEKISTAEILAKIRAEKKGADAAPAAAPPPAPAPAAAASVPEAPPVAPAPVAPKKAVPAAKPGSTSDILAAIRAAKGGAPAPASEGAAPVAAKVAPTKVAAAASSDGPKLSVEQMLKAVRGEAAAAAVVATPAAPTKPTLPPMPVKPPAAKDKKAAAASDRRSFIAVCFSPLAIAWSSMVATTIASLLATARMMFPNVLVEPPTKFKIGSSSDYPLGTVSTKWLAARGVWIVHTDQYKSKNTIYALASVCTHLGCTPNWLEGEQKYKCPCHGSGFYITGINFEGPAPRPLERVGIRVAPDGMLEVDKSVKFQEEMGQWDDPASFVDAALA
jgi:cytochrome b6-f complex iron-sulfur subunit